MVGFIFEEIQSSDSLYSQITPIRDLLRMLRHLHAGLWIINTPNVDFLFIYISMKEQKLSFIAAKNFLGKIGIVGQLVLGPFTERVTRLLVVRLQSLHELDFVRRQTKVLPQKTSINVMDKAQIVARDGEGTHSGLLRRSAPQMQQRLQCVRVVKPNNQLCWMIICAAYWTQTYSIHRAKQTTILVIPNFTIFKTLFQGKCVHYEMTNEMEHKSNHCCQNDQI